MTGVGNTEASDSRPGSASDAGRRLTLLYTFALSSVAVLSIGAQWLIQHQLRTGESDSRVINVAGRQRMLSQRLAKSALRLREPSDENAPDARDELCETLSRWSAAHRALQQGDAGLKMPGGNTLAVQALFAEIAEDFDAMRIAAETLCRRTAADEAAVIATIQRHEATFLAGMDRLVSQYVSEAERRVARLRRLEWTILSLTLLVLLAEGLFVFRPAVRRIRNTVSTLSTLGENLRLARDEAEQANAAKTRFLANVSHELRTPMTAVLGMTELAQQSDNDAERRDYLNIVEEAGETLLGLLNDLIDLSQIDSDRVELREERFAPGACVERVARMMKPRCDEKGLDFTISTPSDEALEVIGDARRIVQVLTNLVSNAIKCTETGRIEMACDSNVAASGSELEVRFEVVDTGSGIAPEDQQRVFEPFTQVLGDDHPRGGVGLGLSICKRIADAMGARIELQSAVDRGTSVAFTCSLPRAAPERLTPSVPRAAADAGSVLVVEDTEVNQRLLREQLRLVCHDVRVVATGEEALAAYRDSDFDSIVIDYQLPGIDGAETARRLAEAARKQGRSAPRLVCVTAHAGPMADSLRRTVFDAVVTKPIHRGDLIRAVAGIAEDGDPDGSISACEPLATELAEAFLQVVDVQRNELLASVADRRWTDAAIVAHRFKGQVGYFAAEDLLSSLATFEQACNAQQHEDALACSREIDASLSRLKHTLAASIERGTPRRLTTA